MFGDLDLAAEEKEMRRTHFRITQEERYERLAAMDPIVAVIPPKDGDREWVAVRASGRLYVGTDKREHEPQEPIFWSLFSVIPGDAP